MLNTYQIQTNRAQGLYNITNQVRQAIAESNITEGLCVVFTPHTTAAITINENADPDVLHDINLGLDTTFPNKREYLHMEQNSDAHIKSSLVAAQTTIIIHQGRPILGRWQDIYFCEFDGPRNRTFYVKTIEG